MRNCQDRSSLLLEAPLLLCLLLPSPSPSPVSAVATFCLSCKEKARLSSALDLELRADISHDTNFVSNRWRAALSDFLDASINNLRRYAFLRASFYRRRPSKEGFQRLSARDTRRETDECKELLQCFRELIDTWDLEFQIQMAKLEGDPKLVVK
ncbi:hypothetical protein IWX49DRAFT_553739 [Phyllosticta citricarpa]|uniref:Uncharacterized protein n=1 Tax=Phyllosticta citricarpa TaxID=55181 RepID=A0ABR1MN59_9PEZI